MSSETLHAGHRARLRNRYARDGLDGFAPHEVLELLLIEVIPQRDLNPLAHRLIDQFGSLSAVLAQPAAVLETAPGLGAATARYLALIGSLSGDYARDYSETRPKFTSASALMAYCERLFSPGDGEQTWVFSLDRAGYLLGNTCVAQGDATRRLTLRQIIEPILRYQGRAVIFLQCRNRGDLQIRSTDVDFTSRLAKYLERLKISLLDSAILASRNLVSLRAAGVYALQEAIVVQEPNDAFYLALHWLDD